MTNPLVQALEDAAENAGALRRNHLHICSYHELCFLIKDVVEKGSSFTITQEVAEWCKKRPELEVSQTMIGWRITRKGMDE